MQFFFIKINHLCYDLALVSVRRIEKFLCEEDVPAWVTTLSRKEVVEDGDQTIPEPGSIRFNQASFAWPQSEESRTPEMFTLGPLTLDLPVGQLAIVTGPTGSGKSSFLCAILGGLLFFVMAAFAYCLLNHLFRNGLSRGLCPCGQVGW